MSQASYHTPSKQPTYKSPSPAKEIRSLKTRLSNHKAKLGYMSGLLSGVAGTVAVKKLMKHFSNKKAPDTKGASGSPLVVANSGAQAFGARRKHSSKRGKGKKRGSKRVSKRVSKRGSKRGSKTRRMSRH